MTVPTVVYTANREPLLINILQGAFAEPLHEQCVLVDDPRALRPALRDAEVLVMMDSQLDDETLGAIRDAPGLRWIQLTSSGFERALQAGLSRDLHVTHAPTVWGPTVAEHAMALLLALVRRIPRSVDLQTRHRWSRSEGSEGLDTLVGTSPLVVGTGAIGVEVAVRLRAFGTDVTGVSRRGGARDERAFDHLASVDRLDELLPAHDVVVLCLPLTPESTGLMGPRRFESMRPGSYLVNVSRGAVIETAALLTAIDDGRLRGVGLDVVDPEPLDGDSGLWDRPEVLISPHVGGYSGVAGTQRLRRFVLDNLERWERGTPPAHPIPDPGSSGQ